jgi:hypothetical protein
MEQIEIESFLEELGKIKEAKAWIKREPGDPPIKAALKHKVKMIALNAFGMGLGVGAGYIVGEKVLPKVLKNVQPRYRNIATAALLTVGGAVGKTVAKSLNYPKKEIPSAK